jgi:SOS response regulatory protein OraA/RecX
LEDLKQRDETEKELQKELRVRIFSDDIRMEFGLDKCAKFVLEKRKLVCTQNLILDINREIQQLNREKSTNTQAFRKVTVHNINK